MNPAPTLPIIEAGVECTRVVHGVGVAVLVRRDEHGFIFRRTYRRNRR
ncbi:MAG TPA: hypothetical protein VH062_01980 [Polyangiaceae bacterium]|nr:hypothetical protein [Polyangiaceae bacterium]